MSYSLSQWFGSVDTDRSGQIDVKELQRALAMGGLNFSLAVVAHMIRWAPHPRHALRRAKMFVVVICVLGALKRLALENKRHHGLSG